MVVGLYSYIKINGHRPPRLPKVSANLVKIFSLKQKINQTHFQLLQKKSNFSQAYSHIFRHIEAESGIFRAPRNSGIFKALVYSERNAYSESCQTSTLAHFLKIVYGYNYFRNISIPRPLLYEINIMNFFSDLIFTPEVFILRKKIWGPRAVNVDVPVSICLPGFV